MLNTYILAVAVLFSALLLYDFRQRRVTVKRGIAVQSLAPPPGAKAQPVDCEVLDLESERLVIFDTRGRPTCSAPILNGTTIFVADSGRIFLKTRAGLKEVLAYSQLTGERVDASHVLRVSPIYLTPGSNKLYLMAFLTEDSNPIRVTCHNWQQVMRTVSRHILNLTRYH